MGPLGSSSRYTTHFSVRDIQGVCSIKQRSPTWVNIGATGARGHTHTRTHKQNTKTQSPENAKQSQENASRDQTTNREGSEAGWASILRPRPRFTFGRFPICLPYFMQQLSVLNPRWEFAHRCRWHAVTGTGTRGSGYNPYVFRPRQHGTPGLQLEVHDTFFCSRHPRSLLHKTALTDLG